MTDNALRAIGDSWASFCDSPAHKWLMSEMRERVEKGKDALLSANPLDMILHPLRFSQLWYQHREAKAILDEIDGMVEDYKKLR